MQGQSTAGLEHAASFSRATPPSAHAAPPASVTPQLGALIVDASFHDLLMPGTHTRPMIYMIYPIILFARGAAIALSYPLLKRMGTGCTWKEAVVMWWGGLRGSVRPALEPLTMTALTRTPLPLWWR